MGEDTSDGNANNEPEEYVNCLKEEFDKKFKEAVKLKDYAINSNLNVSDKTIEYFSTACSSQEKFENKLRSIGVDIKRVS